jgi:uncharacterized repeat protein (TIGR01451 family)
VTVKAPAPQQGNLSKSSKMVSRASVAQGDTVTYTLMLRNTSDVTAAARLTDVLPAHTRYVSDSLGVNLGTAGVADGVITWTGDIVSGTPVALVFAARVEEALPPDTVIANTALIDDGAGGWTSLMASAMYQPSFGLRINDGAAYTRIPTVTLHYTHTWPGIVAVRFSNDAGFLINSGWMSAAAPREHAGWLLDTSGDHTVPRAVYAQFRDAGGATHGPVHASTIYDPDPPAVASIRIISVSVPSLLNAVLAGESLNALVRITSLDANSGANVVALSSDPGMRDAVTYTLRGGASLDVVMSITGNPFGVPGIYARVNDRAGNASVVGYEPLIRRTFVYFVYKNSR